MIKKLSTILLAACMAAPSMAQTYSSTMFFGGSSTFYKENTQFLLPTFTNTSGSVGLPNGSTSNSGDLNRYLNISGLNNNNLTNIVGFEGKYFISDCWDINMQFSMNINLTPKKDYVEGDYTVEDMIIPAQKYINAQMTNNWYVSLGSNHYFKTANPRIHPYLGASIGFQMARIETAEPYTGDFYDDGVDSNPIPDGPTDPDNPDYSGDSSVNDDEGLGNLPTQVYVSGSRAGQMFGIKAAGVAGIEYSIAPGLVLGFQFQPLAYDRYNASHHNIKLFDMPMLKLGIRF